MLLIADLDFLQMAAFKAMKAGDKDQAMNLMMLGAFKNVDMKPTYPKNEALFARFIETQSKHKGKVTPEMIFALAMNEQIPALAPDKTFAEIFGVSAFG